LRPEPDLLRPHLYCFLTIFFFSTIELAGKLLGPGVSPYTITAWRFLIGGLLILPFAIRQKRAERTRISPRALIRMGLLGILNVCVSMLILQHSIRFGKASVTAVIVSVNPLFVSLFASLILREKLTRERIISLAVGLAGLMLIIFGEMDTASARYLNLPLGMLLAVLTAVSFGLYTVLTKKVVLEYGNMVANSASFIIGSLSLFLINALLGKPLLFPLSPKNFLLILYLGVFVSGIAYLLYFEGMRKLSSSVASQYFFLKPVIASLLAYAFLGETLTLVQILAVGFIIFSMAKR
jgi:drug/metabolite transporter (DMT)-like permease